MVCFSILSEKKNVFVKIRSGLIQSRYFTSLYFDNIVSKISEIIYLVSSDVPAI